MKYLKKTFCTLLVVVMALAMAVPAFAAGTGKITVSNPVAGEEYTAYKVFDVNYDSGKSSYAYSIDKTSEWLTTVQGYAGVTLTEAVTGNKYIVEKNENFSAATFANALKAALSGKTGTKLTADGNALTASGLDLGYYFVSSTNGSLCNLTTTNPEVTIRDKNDVPFDKEDNKDSVEVGETVSYTITGKIPDTTGFDSYVYKISDTMSSGLTFKKDVSVTVDGVTLDDSKYVLNNSDTGFDLTIKVKELQEKVGKEIKVTYTAVVNENAVSQISKNSAKLTYSNDPTNGALTTETTPDEETVYTAKIVINKYEKGNNTNKLADAKFVLKNEAGKFYKYTAKTQTMPAKVEWVDNQSDATEVTTDGNGAADFKGLKDGTYNLVETAAPSGYNMLTAPVAITINGSAATTIDLTSLTVTSNVENGTGTTLPETGGIGTKIFYAVGGILVLGAGIMLVAKKRTEKVEK